MKSHWISHKGKSIFYADFSYYGADLQGLRAEATAVIDAVRYEKPGTVFTITDFTATSKGLTLLENTLLKLYTISRRGAIIGAGTMRQGSLETLNRLVGQSTFSTCDNIEQAIAHLFAGVPDDAVLPHAMVYETRVSGYRFL